MGRNGWLRIQISNLLVRNGFSSFFFSFSFKYPQEYFLASTTLHRGISGLDYLSFAAYEEAPETHKFILGERVSILYISLLKYQLPNKTLLLFLEDLSHVFSSS